MIDLTGIFTLWCFHDVKNSIPNNAYVNTRAPKFFLGIFAPIHKKKYGIDIGSTIRYSNLIFRKNEFFERMSIIRSTKLD